MAKHFPAGQNAGRSLLVVAIVASQFGVAVGNLIITAVAQAQSPLPDDTDFVPLDEIVVTARKVEERVQTVPMSVQVLSGEFLDLVDVSQLYELQFSVPGLVVNNRGGFGARFTLRGITDQGGNSLSVATHLDGVYLGDANLAIGRLFDLERIEVLKGPQGTLYGRNATGGSINFISRMPQQDFNAAIEAAHGSFATTRLQGHINVPLTRSAVRLAFAGAAGDGFIRNTVDDRKFAENDFWAIRGSWLFELTDRLQFGFMAQRVVDDGGSGELWLPNPTFMPDRSDIHLTTVTLADPLLVSRNDHVNFNVDYDLGFARLRSISGYARNEVNDRDDCAGLPFLAGCIREILPGKHRQFSQEIHLASQPDAAVGWLLGANYFSADVSTHFFQFTPVLNPLPTINALSTSDEKAVAMFGQLALRLAERWSLTGGLRFSYEDWHVTDIGTGTSDSKTLAEAANDWDHVSWRVDLEYQAGDDVLYYAGVSTGFKSGGVTTENLPNGEFDTFDPEELTAYEIGVKSQWRDRQFTLNAAAFLYDFDNLQVSTIYFVGADTITEIINAAKTEVYGLDVSANFRFGERWTIDAGAVWLPQREFTDFRDDPVGGNLTGNKISRAPEWTTVAAVGYEYRWQGHGRLSGRLEHNYRSDIFFTQDNNPQNAQGGFGLLNLLVRFDSLKENWYVFAAGRNLLDEDYFTQVFFQSSPGYPVTWELGFGLNF